MKILSVLMLIAFTGGAATSAFASSQGPGTVSTIHVMDNGVVMFHLTGNRSSRPACATEARWAFNSASLAGQAKLSTLLTAYSSGKQIIVHGAGICTDWADTETLNWFHTAD